MDKILKFLNKRIEELGNVDSEEPEFDKLDGEGIYDLGHGDGRFAELVFIKTEIEKMMEELK